jgi:hypothetical protein
MVTDRGLGQANRTDHVADASFAFGLCGDEAQQPKPYGIGKRLESRRKLLRIGLAESAM